jgi:hypothetical protein
MDVKDSVEVVTAAERLDSLSCSREFLSARRWRLIIVGAQHLDVSGLRMR